MHLVRPASRMYGVKPRRIDLVANEREHVADGAMSYVDLEALIRDIEWEPDWRREADENCRYYDGYQTTPEQDRLAKEGQPIAVVNLIARTVNTLLGNEARARTSWRLSADSEEDFGDVADALQVKLTEAQRETYADMSISEAYGSMAKAGIGWVEVSRVADFFADVRYRVKPVHRNEIWWDWRSKELDLSDARWLMRQQWHDLDDLEAMLPEWAELFRYYGNESWTTMTFAQALHATDIIRRAEDTRKSFRVGSEEWLDTGRRRIKTYECWYRVRRPAVALVLASGPAKVYDKSNPLHQEALARGMGKLVKTWRTVVRMAMFVGPHRIMDVETERKRFPYIPFFAFREDENRSPYSMVSGMRYPQDEYNARRSRLMWLLQAAQVIVDDDALAAKYNDLHDLAREIMRPDAMIVLDKNRKRDQALRVERNTQLPGDQVNVMIDSKNLIMEQPGVSSAMMGDKVPGVTAGVAFNSLVTQSNIAIGDHDDNYRYARRAVGEALFDLIIEDHRRPNMKLKVGTGRKQRIVVLNTEDDQGLPINKVEGAALKVALDDAPNTPAYKMQQQTQIGAVLQVAGNDQAARAVLIPAFIEATDLPNRESDAKWLRQQYGVPQPGDRQGQAEADKAREQAQAQQQALQQQAVQLDLKDKAAGAAQKESAAQLNMARVKQIGSQIEQAEAAEAAAGAERNEDALIAEVLAEAQGA